MSGLSGQRQGKLGKKKKKVRNGGDRGIYTRPLNFGEGKVRRDCECVDWEGRCDEAANGWIGREGALVMKSEGRCVGGAE